MNSDTQHTLIKRVFHWLDHRYQLSAFLDFLKHKSVPVHAGFYWYYFGGVALFLFFVQVVSGLLLLMYYIPGQDTAYETVRMISAKIPFGWLVRSVHSWSANFMVLALFIHMFSVFFTRSYKCPRELTWVTGVLLFFLTLGFGFSGYLLPWNELAFFATKVGTDMIGVVPVIGKPLLHFLRGGEDVSVVTLSRFFGIHVAILPGLFTMLIGLHLLFVQRQGISEPVHFQQMDESKKKRMPFFPNFVLRDILLWVIVYNLVVLMAVFYPWELGVKADPFAPTPDGIRPEWYFLFAFQTLKIIPSHLLGMEGELLAILVFGLGGFLWLFLPFIDRSPESKPNRILTSAGVMIVVYIIVMTVWGYWGH